MTACLLHAVPVLGGECTYPTIHARVLQPGHALEEQRAHLVTHHSASQQEVRSGLHRKAGSTPPTPAAGVVAASESNAVPLAHDMVDNRAHRYREVDQGGGQRCGRWLESIVILPVTLQCS